MSDKNEIISSYGLDISSTCIQWEGWSPHKKYSDCVVISNLNTKTVNLCIESLPKSKHFTIEEESSSTKKSRGKKQNVDDKVIKIRGGHSKRMLVHFAPSEIKNYSDELTLSLVSSSSSNPSSNPITISLRADIPKTSLQIPKVIDFGSIAVKEEWRTAFEMVNDGDTDIEFQWMTANSPLTFDPAEGVVDGHSSKSIEIRFTPQSASCLEMKVPLRLSDEQETMTMAVLAMCSYPFFRISSKVVDLGAISIGDCKRKLLRIENCSAVSASIDIVGDHVVEDNMQSVFSIDPVHCRIDSHSFIEIAIEFKPRTVGVQYTQHCCIRTECGYKVRFEIHGQADSPKISSSLKLINFESVEVGKRRQSTFTLTNHSIIDSHFEFINVGEPETSRSSFIVTPKRGTIASNQALDVVVRFKPNHPMMYRKRIYAVIHHHVPLCIQLIGCGIDDKTKFILQPRFESMALEVRGKMAAVHDHALSLNHTNMAHHLFSKLFNLRTAGSGDDREEEAVHSSTDIVQFESCSLSQGIAPYRDITLFNKGTALITTKWDVESSKTSKLGSQPQDTAKNVFAVFPPFMDIRSVSSADFSAAFQPSQDLMYFYDKIDCYFLRKLSHDDQDPQQRLHLNCLSIDLFGHSFAKSSNQWPVDVQLSTDRVEFTPCSLGSSIYATVKVVNRSCEHPVVWKIDSEPKGKDAASKSTKKLSSSLNAHQGNGTERGLGAESMFHFNPVQGYIPPNAFQIVVAKFEPSQPGTTTFNTNIVFNDRGAAAARHHDVEIKQLQLIGVAVEPKLQIDREIHVIPTCVGMSSIEYVQLYNYSPIPIRYRWAIPERFADGILTMDPMEGVLEINEKRKTVLRFAPDAIAERYRMECKCYYSTVGDMQRGAELEERYEELTINACCNQSIVEFIPTESDFGCILIDGQTTRSVAIQNNADCKLNCDFRIETVGRMDVDEDGLCDDDESQNGDGDEDDGKSVSEESLEICPFITNCDIPPKTRKQLELNIHAITPGVHEYKLVAKVRRIDGKGNITSFSTIRFEAVWPTLSVVDIQTSSMMQSKEALWSKFSINALNMAFESELSKFERDWNDVHIETRNVVDEASLDRILQRQFQNIDFDFGVKQLKLEEDTTVFLKVSNRGAIAAAVHFKYRPQMLCAPENWVENDGQFMQHRGDSDEDDGRHDHLFNVEPRHFELAPNESTVVSFSYSHRTCGEHRTSILMSVQNGKQMTVNLFGETVASNFHPRLSVPSATTHLKAQPIGLLDGQSLTQFIPIRNLSNHDLRYSVDSASIDRLNAENYGFTVIEVLNVEGVIRKNATCSLRVRFRPIEVKEYAFTLRVNAAVDEEDIESAEATFLNVPIVGHGVNYQAPRPSTDERQTENSTNYVCFGRSYDGPQVIQLRDCHVRLSGEQLDFGAIPLRANMRRAVMVHNEQSDYAVQFQWQKLIEGVTIKEMNGEIQPNSSVVTEICIRSDDEAMEINGSVCCLLWNTERQWRLYLKVECSIMTDAQIRCLEDTEYSDLIKQRHLIQTDKPLPVNTSLLSPRNQKQMAKMGREADEAAVECCKSMVLKALRSDIVQKQLANLPPYSIPIALDMSHSAEDTEQITWQQVQQQMDSQKGLVGDTEFHDFLEYFISETVFNVTSEMVENMDIEHENNMATEQ